MEARLAALEEWTRGVDVQGTVQRIQADSEAAIQGLLRQVSEREANVFAGLKSMQKQVEVLSTAVEVQAITKGLLEDMQTDLSAAKKAQAALREDVDRLQKRPENPGIATLRETLNKAMAEELLGVIDSQRRTHERLSAFEESHAALLPLHNAHETQLQMLSLKSDDMERRLAQAQEDLGHSERCHTAVEARLSELGTRATAAPPAQPAPRAPSPSQAPVNKMVLDTVDKLTSQQASLGDQLAESHSELLQALDRNQGTHAAALAAHATTLAQLEERASTLESNGAYAVDLTDRVVALEGVVAAGGEEGDATRARLAGVEASCETLAAAQSGAEGRQKELELLVVGTPDPAIIKLRQTVDEARREADAVVRRVAALEGRDGRSDAAAAGAAAQVEQLGRRCGALDDSAAELTSAFNVLTRTAQAHDQRLGALEGAAPLQKQQQQQQQQQHAEYTYVRSDAGGDAFEVVDAALGAPPTPPDAGSSDAAGDDGNLPPPPPPPQQQPQLLPHPTASVAAVPAAAPVPAREAPPPAAAAAVAYETVPVIPCSPPPKPPPPQQQQQEPTESSVSVPPPPPPPSSASPSAAHAAQYAASPTRTAFSAAHHRKSGSVAAAAASATTDRQELWRRQQVAARQASEAARADRRSPSPFEEAVLEGSRRQCSDARRELARTRAERRRAEDELDGVCAQMSKIQLTFKHLSAKQQSMDSDENLQSQLAQETHAPESAFLRGELGQVTEDITRAKHNILQKEKLLCAKTRELRGRVSGLRQSEHALLTELSTVEPLAGLARERSLSPHHGI